MATSRPFTYNPNSLIPGTEKFGGLTVGYPTSGFESTGLQWWNGPDEDLGYVIATTMVDSNGNGTQPTSIPGVFGNVGFNRTKTWMYSEFIDLVNTRYNQSFTGVTDAKLWLESNGKWTSFVDSTGNTINNFIDRVEYNGGVVESESSLSSSVAEIGEDLFNQASLVITPNGYEQSLLFSLKPTNGSGDMVVSRATTATRVNEDGLIEEVPYNLVRESQTYETSSWYKLGGSVTSNVTTSPDGTLTADLFTEGTNTGNHNLQTYYYVVQYVRGKVTFTGWFKPNGRNELFITEANQTGFGARVNISTGNIVSTIGSGTTATIVKNPDGWCFVTIKFNFPNVINFVLSYSLISYNINNPGGTNSYSGDGVSGIYVWGSQLVKGDIVKPYFQTTDRLNVPRIDYTNGVGRLLVEPQRTNLFQWSEQFDNTDVWLKLNCSISANVTISPDGTSTADKIIEDGTSSRKQLVYNGIPAASRTIGYFVFSVFVKKSELDRNILISCTSLERGKGCIIDLNNNIIIGDNITLPNGSGDVVSANVIENKMLSNGWIRVSVLFNTSGTDYVPSIGIVNNNLINYSGDSVSGFYIWGAQLEARATLTSYIPTLGGTVTRNIEVLYLNDLQNKNILSSNWSIYCEFIDYLNSNNNGTFLLGLKNSSGTDWIGLYRNYTALLYLSKKENNGSVSVTQSSVQVSNGNIIKVVIKCDSNTLKVYINGILAYSSTFTNPVLMTNFELAKIGSNSNSTIINSSLAFKTALTDQECINLTTL